MVTFALTALAHSCSSHLKTWYAEGVDCDPRCLLFVSPEVGFVGGTVWAEDHPPFGADREAGRDYSNAVVCKTTDGGHTWKSTPLDTGNVVDLYARDGIVYATVWSSQGGRKSMLYRSTDLGETWERIGLFDQEIVNSFYALDSSRLYYYSQRNSSILMASRDGGRSWHSLGEKGWGFVDDKEHFYSDTFAFFVPISPGDDEVFSDTDYAHFMERLHLLTNERDTIYLPLQRQMMIGNQHLLVLRNGLFVEVYRIDGTELVLQSSLKIGEKYYNGSFLFQAEDKVYLQVRGELTTPNLLLFCDNGGKSWKIVKFNFAQAFFWAIWNKRAALWYKDKYYLWLLLPGRQLAAVAR